VASRSRRLPVPALFLAVATAIAAVLLGAFDSLWSWLSAKIY